MPYQYALCTTVPERIRHKGPHAAAEHERLEECATQSAANHDHTGCYSAVGNPHSMQYSLFL